MLLEMLPLESLTGVSMESPGTRLTAPQEASVADAQTATRPTQPSPLHLRYIGHLGETSDNRRIWICLVRTASRVQPSDALNDLE